MKRVAATLAPLLACPAFWLWHVVGAILCIPAWLYAWFPGDSDKGAVVAAFVLPFWSATVLTSLQRDLLASPVSFCLPGHRSALRRASLLVGIATSLAASLPVFTYPGLGGLSLCWAVWSAFCFSLIIYVAVVRILFLVDNVIAPLGPGMLVGFVLVEFPTTRSFVESVALFAPWWNTVFLAVLGMFGWRWIGSADLARRTCGGRFLSMQTVWRRSAVAEFGASGMRESLAKGTWGLRQWLLRQFWARISHAPALSFRRHLAATQFEVAGQHLLLLNAATVPLTLLAILALLVIAGYAPLRVDRPETPEANAVYIVNCVLGMQLFVPVFTAMLLPAGRRERFWSAVAIAFANGLVMLAASLFLYILLLVMAALAPPLSINGKVHFFRPAGLAPAFVPLVVLPLNCVLKVVCKRWLLLPEFLLLLTAAIVIVKGGAALGKLSCSSIVVLVSISWAILLGILYAYSFRGDLVRE